MVGAVFNEGVRGLQVAQREIDRAAVEIARAPVIDQAATAQPQPVPAQGQTAPEQRQDIIQPLVAMERQEQIFNASAKVISTANQTLGTLLDTTA